MHKKIEPRALEVSREALADWQSIVDIMSELGGTPAGLIMRIVEQDIEVFLASNSEGNPYQPGDHEPLADSGLYCETVIRTREPLLVPDALADPAWRNNPDVRLNMISYFGYPIMLPDGTPFGTICILDSRPNAYSDTIRQLIARFRDLLQGQLELLYMNAVLDEENRSLNDYLAEIQSLRGLIPICAACKKIKDSKGYWKSVEAYLINHPTADFTHGYCPQCYEQAMAELERRRR